MRVREMPIGACELKMPLDPARNAGEAVGGNSESLYEVGQNGKGSALLMNHHLDK